MTLRIRRRANSALLALFPCVAASAADSLEFDAQALRRRGLDPALAQYFQHAPRFTAGTRQVGLWVNGERLGKATATFDAEGELCLDSTFLAQAQLQSAGPGCEAFRAAWPATEVQLVPNENTVKLLVSPQAKVLARPALAGFTGGGSAALLNYQVYASRYESEWGGRQQAFGATELGFNSGGWLVRSRQSFSHDPNGTRAQWLYGYAQTSLPSAHAVFQLGQLNLQNSVLPGVPITGVQWLPDTGLPGLQAPVGGVEGIANAPARVEVRQGQALIYSTLVPAGPFRLVDVKPLNYQVPLEVTVVEGNAAPRQFSVPVAALRLLAAPPAGRSIAVGQVRRYSGGALLTPFVFSASQGWALGTRYSVNLGGLLSDQGYTGLGASLDARLASTTGLAFTGAVSSLEGTAGASATVALRQQVADRLHVSASLTQRSAGHRELADSVVPAGMQRWSQRSAGVGAGWGNPTLGNFSFNYSQASSQREVQQVAATWNRSFGPASISVRVQRELGPSGAGSRQPGAARTAAYVSLSMPLGSSGRVTSYARDGSRGLQWGTQYAGTAGERLNYRVDAERDVRAGTWGGGGELGWEGDAMSLAAGVQESAGGGRTWSGRASGGLAWHRQGITLSPAPVGETFAVAEVGNAPGVRLQTPGGTVRTDRHGRALIAQVSPWRTGEVRIDTLSLPPNVDVKNGVQTLAVSRGAVQHVVFDTAFTRRVLLDVRLPGGSIPSKGSGVYGGGMFLTTVANQGRVYLADALAHDAYYLQFGEGQQCRLLFDLPDTAGGDSPYEQYPATCQEPTAS